jgi:hypothetical protein
VKSHLLLVAPETGIRELTKLIGTFTVFTIFVTLAEMASTITFKLDDLMFRVLLGSWSLALVAGSCGGCVHWMPPFLLDLVYHIEWHRNKGSLPLALVAGSRGGCVHWTPPFLVDLVLVYHIGWPFFIVLSGKIVNIVIA